MAQHDYVISNGTGAAVRSDLNNALAAVVSQNSGATAPTTTYAYMPWADTTTGLFKIRNAANNGWITLYKLDGTFSMEAGSASSPGLYFTGDSNTGIYSPGADQFGITTGGTARLTVDASGNINMDSGTVYVDAANNRLGIGTTSPSYLLHASSSNPRVVATTTSTSDSATFEAWNTGSGQISITQFATSQSGTRFGANRANGASLFTYLSSYLSIGTVDSAPIIFGISDAEKARIDTSGRLLVGTSSVSGQEAGKFVVNNNSSVTSQAAMYVRGNANTQGTATKFTIVRHCPLAVLGTKLKIPFVSQGELNSNTICKVWGHGARYNTRDGLPFEITFGVGHSTVLSNLYSWGGGGNYASIALSGMDVEITFTTAYSSSIANGVFVCIEYMTNAPDYSINIANIAMN